MKYVSRRNFERKIQMNDSKSCGVDFKARSRSVR